MIRIKNTSLVNQNNGINYCHIDQEFLIIIIILPYQQKWIYQLQDKDILMHMIVTKLYLELFLRLVQCKEVEFLFSQDKRQEQSRVWNDQLIASDYLKYM